MVTHSFPHLPSPAHLKGEQLVETPDSFSTELRRSALQTEALPLGTHFEAVQVKPSAQSLGAEQSVRHPATVQP